MKVPHSIIGLGVATCPSPLCCWMMMWKVARFSSLSGLSLHPQPHDFSPQATVTTPTPTTLHTSTHYTQTYTFFWQWPWINSPIFPTIKKIINQNMSYRTNLTPPPMLVEHFRTSFFSNLPLVTTFFFSWLFGIDVSYKFDRAHRTSMIVV